MRILHFADLHLGVETYGCLDPTSGLPSRLLDFLAALDQVIDYAIESEVDLVLFCGDAYKSRDPSQTQQREFAKRIKRLSSSGIPTFLLIGNHDLPHAMGRATAVEIFDTLKVSNVYVGGRPGIYRIQTKGGVLQVVALPWVRRSALLSMEGSKNLTIDQINDRLQEILTDALAINIQELDPSLPSLLAAHVWVYGAQRGSERAMTVGQEHSLLLSNVANEAFDYVALGHIHKHQVLCYNPPVVYSGSLERLDFSEEEGEKGFYLVEIKSGPGTGKREASFDFHPVEGRRFLTIKVDIDSQDPDPTRTVLHAIAQQEHEIKGAVIRLQTTLPPHSQGQLQDNELRKALKEAHFFAIAKEVKHEPRIRLGSWGAEEIKPLEALKAYLQWKKVPPSRARVLLQYGERLIGERDSQGE